MTPKFLFFKKIKNSLSLESGDAFALDLSPTTITVRPDGTSFCED